MYESKFTGKNDYLLIIGTISKTMYLMSCVQKHYDIIEKVVSVNIVLSFQYFKDFKSHVYLVF